MRNPFASMKAMLLNMAEVVKVLRRQRMNSSLLLALCLLLLALLFSFLAFAPVLSPFIYPLF